MLIKRALYKESSYEITLKLDEKCGRGISYSSQIVFFPLLHYTCFSGTICPLQVPDPNLHIASKRIKLMRTNIYKVLQFIRVNLPSVNGT